jgi:hypothetical protein
MEIGVGKEYVITTKGTPLSGAAKGLGRRGWGEVDRKKNAVVVVAASTAEGGLVRVWNRSQVVCVCVCVCVGWISKFFMLSLSLI